ncbi:Ig domain-containing protein [Streptomyces sp. NPDC048506]|uniref:Ig domain-containing protein n=1 Tax=Streptomyces sp. NPDC048506 TaxID=3155028 RepID=UPI00343A5E97
MSARAGSVQALTIQPAGGAGQHAGRSEAFPQPLKVRLVERNSLRPVSGAEVTFCWASMSQQALFEGDESAVTVRTDAGGYAQTPLLMAGDAVGTALFTVTAEGADPEELEITVDL